MSNDVALIAPHAQIARSFPPKKKRTEMHLITHNSSKTPAPSPPRPRIRNAEVNRTPSEPELRADVAPRRAPRQSRGAGAKITTLGNPKPFMASSA